MPYIPRSFEPAELLGDHYHPIGGRYASLDLAVEAVKAHGRTKHGSSGTFRFHQSPDGIRSTTLVEVCGTNRDPQRIQSLYKVFETPPGS